MSRIQRRPEVTFEGRDPVVAYMMSYNTQGRRRNPAEIQLAILLYGDPDLTLESIKAAAEEFQGEQQSRTGRQPAPNRFYANLNARDMTAAQYLLRRSRERVSRYPEGLI